MNYPKIKHLDVCSFYVRGEGVFTRVSIGVDGTGLIRLLRAGVIGEKALDVGFQDCPQLMENGITNFRIHERADGTKIWMKGDVIYRPGYGGDKGFLVTEVYGDSYMAPGYGYEWDTFNAAQEGGWKLKEAPEEECEHELEDKVRLSMPPQKQCVKCLEFIQEKDWHKYKNEAPEGGGAFDTLALSPGLIAKEIGGRVAVSTDGETYTKQEIADVLKGRMGTWDPDCPMGERAHTAISEVAEKLGISLTKD